MIKTQMLGISYVLMKSTQRIIYLFPEHARRVQRSNQLSYLMKIVSLFFCFINQVEVDQVDK